MSHDQSVWRVACIHFDNCYVACHATHASACHCTVKSGGPVATIQRLLAKRCDLRSEQNRTHGTLIHRLPTEITNYIFESLAPTRTEWGVPVFSQQRTTPYISICRSWRDIAWSNPFLWSTIHIVLGRNVASSESSPINFVQDWIRRSRTLPLTLNIEGCPDEESKGLIDAISRCSNRWHSLSFDISLELLNAFHHKNIQCHLLKSLRINVGWGGDTVVKQSVPLSNPTMSPEKIEISGVIPFQSLQISWNRLTSAKARYCNAEDLVQLFRHASQMTCCYILDHCDRIFQYPPIIHHRLKNLIFNSGIRRGKVLRSLTLPCLQEFHTNKMNLLKWLPALVQRSSCPLTRITFDLIRSIENEDQGLFDDLQPLPGVTDLAIEYLEGLDQITMIKRLLLEEYFPHLRHLILRLDAFLFLWEEGIVSTLLDRQRVTRKGGHPKILVQYSDQCRTGAFKFDVMKCGKQLNVDISLREDGFEILIPED